VTFQYRPPHLVLASVLSIGAVGVLVVLLGGWLVLRRRRRPVDTDVKSVPVRAPESVPAGGLDLEALETSGPDSRQQ
jgi:hypothetical protein